MVRLVVHCSLRLEEDAGGASQVLVCSKEQVCIPEVSSENVDEFEKPEKT